MHTASVGASNVMAVVESLAADSRPLALRAFARIVRLYFGPTKSAIVLGWGIFDFFASAVVDRTSRMKKKIILEKEEEEESLTIVCGSFVVTSDLRF